LTRCYNYEEFFWEAIFMGVGMDRQTGHPTRKRQLPGRLAGITALLATALCLAGQSAEASEATQQVWLVSTRSAPRCGDLEAERGQVRFWRLDDVAPCRWIAADAEAFCKSADPATPTVIFIHGYDNDADSAVQEGWDVYCRMKEQAGERPFRLVVWSWPTERMLRRPRKDVQLKTCYSDIDSYYLAGLLRDIPPGSQISLVGFSLGARVATGSLQLLAGGQVAGRHLPAAAAGQADRPAPHIRAVLIGAALDADALLPGHSDGLALSLVEQALVTRNGCDRALRFYPRIYGRRGPDAMGFVGPLGCSKLETIDVACSVGRQHAWVRYSIAPELTRRLGWYMFLEPPKSPAKK
jgi:hypothetical protein